MFLFCRNPGAFQQVKAEGTFEVSRWVEAKPIPLYVEQRDITLHEHELSMTGLYCTCCKEPPTTQTYW